MDSKTISTAKMRPKAAFTLIEMMVASALGLVGVTSILALSWYSGISFAAIANYVSLDQSSQLALDKMSREIREARRLTGFSPTSISFADVDDQPLHFIYDENAKTLLRVSNGETNTLLAGCDFLKFSNYQRNTISNTFDAYDPAYVTNTKLVQVSWTCSRKILGAKVNSESMHSSKITLRNH